jgi:DNA-binding MarR family transcriptional regulator
MMDLESQRDLQVLEAVAGNHSITQRTLAVRLGIAVGLTNLYLKRLARKGYIKFVSVQPNRIMYLLTPKGIAEKSRLTFEFMEHSLFVYGQVRMHLKTMVLPYLRPGSEVAIFGTGEAAELAYLSLREHGVEPVAIFDKQPGRFLNLPVHDIRDHASVPFDALIVARLDQADAVLAELIELGVPEERLVALRPSRRKSAAEKKSAHVSVTSR